MSTDFAIAMGFIIAILTATLLNSWKTADHLRKIEEHLADMRRREKARR